MSSISRKEIYNIARKVKQYVEKNYEIPSEVNGVRHGEYTYLMCQAVYKGNSAFNRKGVGMAYKPTGDSLNRKIYKSEYVRGAKKIVEYVEANGKLPNYLVLGSAKIHEHLYEYMYAKIVTYLADHNQLPAYEEVKSSALVKPTPPKPVETKRKYGHSQEKGCDDMGQNNGYYCACHSLQEVFRNLTGIVVPQSTIASVCGTTTNGTGHSGMDTCVAWFNRNYGKNLKVSWKHFSDLGWSGIKEIVNSNNKDCIIHNLYRNQWGHYEVVNGVSSNVNVQNSLGSTCSRGCYCGWIEYRSKGEFEDYISGISQKSVMVITNG